MNVDRSNFPILKEYTYLNTARYSALPNNAIQAQQDFLTHLKTHGSWEFDSWSKKYEDCRTLATSLIGGSESQTFFLPNVSLGFNMAAQYLPKRRVVTLSSDFPTVNMTWEPHGFECVMEDHREPHFYDSLERRLQDKEQIVALSWIQSADGFEINLPWLYEICKEKNHILVLDGTQGYGAIPFSYDPDVKMLFFASGFKWVMAGYGIAVGHLSAHLAHYFSAMRGWFSVDFKKGGIKEGASHLEVGNATYINAFALHEGLKMITKLGVSNIRAYNSTLVQHFINAVDRSIFFPESNSSIISFQATEKEYASLIEAKIQSTLQKDRIRISPHFYNTFDDINALIAVLNQ